MAAVYRDDGADGDAGCVDREDQHRDALLRLAARIGPDQAEDHVGVVGEARPDLLPVDDVVVSVAHGGVRSDARSDPDPGSEKPWHQ